MRFSPPDYSSIIENHVKFRSFRMNKYLIRLVALALVPCLLADPVTASAFSWGQSPMSGLNAPVGTVPNSSIRPALFTRQALFARMVNVLPTYARRQKVEEIQTVKTRIPSLTPSFPWGRAIIGLGIVGVVMVFLPGTWDMKMM